MWSEANNKWLANTQTTAEQAQPTKWKWHMPNMPDFNKASKWILSKTVRRAIQIFQIPVHGNNHEESTRTTAFRGSCNAFAGTYAERPLAIRTEEGLSAGYERQSGEKAIRRFANDVQKSHEECKALSLAVHLRQCCTRQLQVTMVADTWVIKMAACATRWAHQHTGTP